jgi:hypothetical protein
MSTAASIFNNATVTISGSTLLRIDQDQQISLFWNIRGPVLGTLPTIQFTVQEVDPSDEITPIGSSATSPIISSNGVGHITVSLLNSNKILISWTIGGAASSFANTSVLILSREIGNVLSTKLFYNGSTTTTSVAASTSSVSLLSNNAYRVGATIFNDSSTNTLYLKLGTTASTSSYSVKLIPGAYFETPFGYTGEIDAIWDGVVGFARISELV